MQGGLNFFKKVSNILGAFRYPHGGPDCCETMRRLAKRSSTPALPRDGGGVLGATEIKAPGKKKPKAKKKKEPANLCDDDLCFIAEETYRRRLLNWSQEKVAKMVGVTRSGIQLIESWQRGLSLRMAGDIARAYSSDTGFFIAEGRAKKNLPEFADLFPQMPKSG